MRWDSVIRGAARVAAVAMVVGLLAGCAGPNEVEYEGSYVPLKDIEQSETRPEKPPVEEQPLGDPLVVSEADGEVELTEVNGPILVRTDFSDDAAWAEVVDQARSIIVDDWFADFSFVNDRDFEGMLPEELRALHPSVVEANDLNYTFFAIADESTFRNADRDLLLVDALNAHEDPLRCIPEKLGLVIENLELANVDWEEFLAGSRNGVIYE